MDDLTEICLRLNCVIGSSTKPLFELYALLKTPPSTTTHQDIKTCLNTYAPKLYKKCYRKDTDQKILETEKSLKRENLTLLHAFDERYPPYLASIPDRPLILFIRGNAIHLQKISVAIVGSRRATPVATRFAYDLAHQLCQHQIMVVSGLARGCDIWAHRGTLDACTQSTTSEKFGTVAVLGNGLNHIYPPEHRKIAHKIVEQQGCLLSECLPHTPPLAQNFPKRNRIIAGMSVATIVIEAGLRSGSLISARLAVEYGREIFAVPNHPNNTLSHGCHQLIRDGAHLLESLDDLSRILGDSYPSFQEWETPAQSREKKIQPDTLSAELLKFLAHIGTEGVGIEDFAQSCHLSLVQAQNILMELEIQGQIAKTLTGKFYRLS